MKTIFRIAFLMLINSGFIAFIILVVQGPASTPDHISYDPTFGFAMVAFFCIPIFSLNYWIGGETLHRYKLMTKARKRLPNLIQLPTGLMVENNNGHISVYSKSQVQRDPVLWYASRMLKGL